MDPIKLTQFSKGSGCGCKIAPEMLEKILSSSAGNITNQRLIVGNETKDDAAVYRLSEKEALISTTDFFTPIVDDAYDFGRIAAANALSDVYAMGGKPLFALAVLGWPVEKLPLELCAEVLRGAREICEKAGVVIAGGHSINIPEPVFGLCVNGIAAPEHIKTNAGARPGDKLILTKPLGSGIYSSALKRSLLSADDHKELIRNLTRINSEGEQLGKMTEVHSLTDVTGFGLAGHVSEMMEASNCCALLNFKELPAFRNLQHYLSQYIFPDNTTRNYNAYKDRISGMDGMEFLTMCDPQTNGGLLISVDPDYCEGLLKVFGEDAVVIGEVTSKEDSYLIKLQ